MNSTIPKRFKPLFKDLEKTWFAGNAYFLGERFTKGFTGALVLPIGLAKRSVARNGGENGNRQGEEILHGEFVLKLDSQSEYEQTTEADHHEEARKWNSAFAKKHMPALKKPPRTVGRTVALLYEIAGHAMKGIESAETKDAGNLESCVRAVSRSLLEEWNPPPHEGEPQMARDFIQQWSGHRLQGANLRATAGSITGRKQVFCFFERPLINPLRFCDTDAGKSVYPLHPIRGMLHCDLHLRNIMVPRKPGTEDFWLIDFAQARKGFLLYDHAYLEMSLLLNEPERFVERERLYNLLVALETDSQEVCPKDSCLLSCIRGLRTEVEKWTNKTDTLSLKGAVEAQFLLARVSAGLNWANKPLKETDKNAALIYAAWAASQFMKDHSPEAWRELIKNWQCPRVDVW